MTRRDAVESLFNDALNAIKDSQNDLEKTVSGYATGITGKPLVDVIDQGDSIIIKADLPGFLKENIKIDVGEYVVEITAHFEEEDLEGWATYVKRERKYSEVKRVIDLPTKIKVDYVTAEFDNGVLQITLPKPGKTEVTLD